MEHGLIAVNSKSFYYCFKIISNIIYNNKMLVGNKALILI